jgi:hypothetical protein
MEGAMSQPKFDFEVDDAIVLILGAPTKVPALKDRLEGITRLEKLIFLLEMETEVGKLLTEKPDFKPHHFGPFSAAIYQAVEILKAGGLLEETGRLSESPEDSWESANLILGDDAQYATRDFKLTEKGRRYYEALASELGKDAVKATSRLKDQFGSLPLRQLIRYVYQRHEGFTERSKIREQILGS